MRRARCALLVAALLVLAGPLDSTGALAGTPADRLLPDVPAGVLEDAANGDVLIARAPDRRRPIASATKLMTALLTLEETRPRQVFAAARYRAAPVESQIGLQVGERMRVSDLLAALLLESANDAAATLAAGISGSQAAFVDQMNARARELGLRNTRYANPIGFDDRGNYSTARDLATLTRTLLRDERFAAIVGRRRAVLSSGDRRRVVENRNTLLEGYPPADGVKTGHTAGAGYVLVGSASGRGAQVVSVVLGAPSEEARDAASRELLSYGLDQFRRETPARAGDFLASAPITGRDARAQLTTPDDVTLTVRRDAGPLRTRVAAPVEVRGPLRAGTRVGSVEFLQAGEVVGSAPVVTAAAVPGPGASSRLAAVLRAPLTWIALTAIVSASALALLRIRAVRARAQQAR